MTSIRYSRLRRQTEHGTAAHALGTVWWLLAVLLGAVAAEGLVIAWILVLVLRIGHAAGISTLP